MSTFLRLGEAARQLGGSVDTARRYVQEGRLPSFRTPGGQTQIRAEDVAALRGLGAVPPPRREARQDAEESGVSDPSPLKPEPEPRRPAWKDSPPWEQRRAEFKADLEIEKIRHEQSRLKAEAARQSATEQARAEEQERLSKLKAYGKIWCTELTLQPMVVRKLNRFVTTEQVPPWLNDIEQTLLVQRYVMGLMDRHRESQRAESQRKADQEMRRIRNAGRGRKR